MKKIFIAATKQNDGKTTLSLGLILNLKQRFKNIGFIKPIGQRYLEEDGQKIDEDSLLIEKVAKIKCLLKDMSPIAVEKGFTERYIKNPQKRLISQKIKEAFQHVASGQDLVVIEGTGHAGVGSVFDHSNATVARLLGAKVIIISSGGVGRPIDEIVLNQALFEKEKVKILGVIINKVLTEKYFKINSLVRNGLKRKGIKVLGVIPYDPVLSWPTVEQIWEETKFELLSGKEYLNQYVSQILVGAMTPQNALNYIKNNCLLVVPADRRDLIEAVLNYYRKDDPQTLFISGLVLTGNIPLDDSLKTILFKAKIPVLWAKFDTYTVASLLHDISVKLRPQDEEKIQHIVQLVRNYVDLEAIIKGI